MTQPSASLADDRPGHAPGPVVRTAPATLGQLAQWSEQQIFPPEYHRLWNMPLSLPLAEPVDREVAVRAVAEIVRRHETFRTTFTMDDAGTLIQRVHEAGHTAVLEVTATADELTGDRPPVPDEFKYTAFDLEKDLSARFAIVLDESGMARWVVGLMNHTASDAHAMPIVLRDLQALLAGDPAPGDAAAPVQPCDIAAEEWSTSGRARQARAIEYLRGQLRALPDALFPEPPAGSTGSVSPMLWRVRRMGYAELQSPALHHAVRELRRTTGIPPTALLFAAYVGLLAQHTGQERIGVNVVSANRSDPATRNAVSCLAQPVLVTFDATGTPSLAELARRCQSALLKGYRHGRYDVREAEALWVAERQRRGETPATHRVFDFWEGDRTATAEDPPGPDDLDVSRTVLTAGATGRDMHAPEQSLRARLHEGELFVSLWADAELLPEAVARQLLLGVEAVLVHACAGDEKSMAEVAGLVGLSRRTH
jgi:hypothetical protein